MSNKFTNNVRTRLYKAGYQGFTKDDYTAAAFACECEDLNNPTKEQLSQAVELLINKQSKQLAKLPSEITTTEVLTGTMTEQSSIATTEEDSNQLAIADTVNLGSMVTSKAAELGMILTSQQVSSIADTIDTSASTFDEILSDVETALLAYADYSANQVDAKIHASLTKVEERVVNRHQQSKDKLAQGLTNISTALEESRTKTKSQLGGILSRLKVQ
jgi:DNA anti-recombination protein RmuC